jgi:tetratricopeptide (TPR) repeat protein
MFKTYFLFIFLLLLSVSVFAQQKRYSTTDQEAIKYYARANQSLDDHLYDEAITQLEQAVKADPKFIEAHAQLADVLRMRHIYKPAITHFLKVIELDPEYNRSVYLKVGDCEITSAQYEPALHHLEKYLTYPNITAQNMAYAQKLISRLQV